VASLFRLGEPSLIGGKKISGNNQTKKNISNKQERSSCSSSEQQPTKSHWELIIGKIFKIKSSRFFFIEKCFCFCED